MMLLDELVKVSPPKVGGREPYFRPPKPDPADEVYVPAWSWTRPRTARERTCPVAILDANGAWLSAAASVEVGHSQLAPARLRTFRPDVAGYWLVTLPTWSHTALMAPWGGGAAGYDRVWLAHPTVRLLFDLAADGKMAAPEIHGAWVTDTRCRLRTWTRSIQDRRAYALSTGDAEQYEALKTAYSQAVILMAQHGRSLVFRPDWSHAIRAQHAATMWRRAWAAFNTGNGPIAAGAVDELAFPADVAASWWQAWSENPLARVPVRIDLSGAMLGTMKVKAVIEAGDWTDWDDDAATRRA